MIPWSKVNWGKIEFLPGSTITVTGEAKQQEASQIATFTAGVTVTNEDKDEAIDEVNTKMAKLIEDVKNFGIDEEDIQTQNVSIFQEPDDDEVLLYRQPEKTKGWMVSNSIEITLRDVDRASELADLLNNSEATNINGPRFSLDDTATAQQDLLQEAIEDARAKAQKVAQASNRKLGKIITVTEGGTTYPMPLTAFEKADSSITPIEPGTETVYKTVTVVFELR